MQTTCPPSLEVAELGSEPETSLPHTWSASKRKGVAPPWPQRAGRRMRLPEPWDLPEPSPRNGQNRTQGTQGRRLGGRRPSAWMACQGDISLSRCEWLLHLTCHAAQGPPTPTPEQTRVACQALEGEKLNQRPRRQLLSLEAGLGTRHLLHAG